MLKTKTRVALAAAKAEKSYPASVRGEIAKGLLKRRRYRQKYPIRSLISRLRDSET
jgi:hypothetical protein